MIEDPTKGLELVPVSGMLYTIGELEQLAQEGALKATQQSRSGRKFAVQFEEGSEGAHAFRVSSSEAMPAVYLRVRFGETTTEATVTRTLETIAEPAPNPWEAKVQTQVLSPLRLGLDESGNATAYDGDTPLSRAELIASFIEPVREAVGDA